MTNLEEMVNMLRNKADTITIKEQFRFGLCYPFLSEKETTFLEETLVHLHSSLGVPMDLLVSQIPPEMSEKLVKTRHLTGEYGKIAMEIYEAWNGGTDEPSIKQGRIDMTKPEEIVSLLLEGRKLPRDERVNYHKQMADKITFAEWIKFYLEIPTDFSEKEAAFLEEIHMQLYKSLGVPLDIPSSQVPNEIVEKMSRVVDLIAEYTRIGVEIYWEWNEGEESDTNISLY